MNTFLLMIIAAVMVEQWLNEKDYEDRKDAVLAFGVLAILWAIHHYWGSIAALF